jgi:hypothetical protein
MRHLSPRPSTRACQACVADLRGMMPHRAPMPTSSQEFRLRLPDLLDSTRLDSTDSTTRRKRCRYVSCTLHCLGRTTFLRLPVRVYQARIGASGRSSARTSSADVRVTGLSTLSSDRLDVPRLTSNRLRSTTAISKTDISPVLLIHRNAAIDDRPLRPSPHACHACLGVLREVYHLCRVALHQLHNLR